MKPEDLSAMLKAEDNYMDTLAECASGNARIDFSVGFRAGVAHRDAQPAGAVNEKVKSTLENVALIAHHGGLIDLSESDALFLIRKITRSWNDPKPDPRRKKVALTAIAAEAQIKE